MRSFIAAVFLAFSVMACSDSTAPINKGFIRFRLDANSCGPIFGTQTLNFTFFIDGATTGSASLGVSNTSPSYQVDVGSHIASASVTNTQYQWQNLTATVNKDATYTYILSCN